MWWERRQWWSKIQALDQLAIEDSDLQGMKRVTTMVAGQSTIAKSAILDDSTGPIYIGRNVRIAPFVNIQGPITIGNNVTIGKSAQIRGPSVIGDNVLIGSFAELKRSILCDGVRIGPGCYVGDSYIEENVFFGAHVRTSNYRFDGGTISVSHEGEFIDSGMDKLGTHIGANTSLGIGCKIYPGRVVPANSTFEMDVHIKKNLAPGHYRIKQDLEKV